MIIEKIEVTGPNGVEVREIQVPSVVPEQVTPRQIKLALLRSGYNLSTIESFILSLSEPQASEVLIWWNEATTFDRSNSVLNEVAPQMGFTEKELDELFIFASAL